MSEEPSVDEGESATEPEKAAEPVPAEPARAEPVQPSSAPAPKSVFRRFLDWTLCRAEFEEARRLANTTPRQEALLRRAKSALLAANHLLEAPERTGEGLAGAHAATLYLESLHWSLSSSRTDLDKAPLSELWDGAAAIVGDIALKTDEVAEVKRYVAMEKPALELPELGEQEQEAAATLLRHTATRALQIADKARRTAETLSLKRAFRVLLSLAVLGAVLLGALWLLPAKQNIAAGKPWTTSSKLCNPQAGECGANTKIFFCTKEEMNPWFQYDLGARKSFSSMTIVNRQDSAYGEGKRAVPLVIEVSNDGKTFREVIRRNDEFSVWKPKFATQTARYVRLRVPRKSFLHLEAVRVHP